MKNIQEKIFDFAYSAALSDATRQKAFKGPESQLRDCESARRIVKDYIDSIFNGETIDFYKTTKAVEDSFQKHIGIKCISGRFSFGNAQKLVNMTVKNMYTVVYANTDLRENFYQCHCPMDNIMIENAIREIEKYSIQDLPDSISEYLNIYGWRGKLRRPWSQIEFDSREQYEIFQEIIRFLAEKIDVSPIEYDYLIWDGIEK